MPYARNNPFSSIPPVTLNVLIAIVVMFVFLQILPNNSFIYRYFVLHPISSPGFYPWQLITHALLHIDFIQLFFSGFALWIFGSQIEYQWGEKRYGFFIVACIIGSGLVHALLSQYPTIGLSGCIFGLLVAFGMMYPERQIMLLFPPIPMKAKYFVLIFGGIYFLSALNTAITVITQLGGAITGFLLIQYWRKKPPFTFSQLNRCHVPWVLAVRPVDKRQNDWFFQAPDRLALLVTKRVPWQGV